MGAHPPLFVSIPPPFLSECHIYPYNPVCKSKIIFGKKWTIPPHIKLGIFIFHNMTGGVLKRSIYVKKNFWKIFDKLGNMFYYYTRITKTLKHNIMKNYKQLFKEGFTFNGKDYSSKSYIMNYYKLVEDILNGVHGDVPAPGVLSKMFMSTVYTDYDKMPKSVRNRKLFKELGDIYVLTNKDINGINSAVKRISLHMNKEVIIR
jgi:hypothetical protein